MQTNIVPNNANFDYSILDNETANFLNEKEKAIKTIVIESATEIGKHLKEAQDRLALNGYGCFQEWIESTVGFSKTSTYRLIERYNFVCSNLGQSNAIEVFENLPKSLSYEISKPSAPKELVEATLNGDISSHKQYKDLEKRLKEEIEKAKYLGRVLDEKDKHDKERDIMIKSLIERKPEVEIVYKEDPKLIETINDLGTQLRQAEHELSKLEEVKAKKHEIEEVHRQIEELKKKRSEFQRDIEENKKIFDFIDKTKKFIKEEMLHIPTLTTHYNQSNTMKQEMKMITDLLDDFNFSLKQKFGV